MSPETGDARGRHRRGPRLTGVGVGALCRPARRRVVAVDAVGHAARRGNGRARPGEDRPGSPSPSFADAPARGRCRCLRVGADSSGQARTARRAGRPSETVDGRARARSTAASHCGFHDWKRFGPVADPMWRSARTGHALRFRYRRHSGERCFGVTDGTAAHRVRSKQSSIRLAAVRPHAWQAMPRRRLRRGRSGGRRSSPASSRGPGRVGLASGRHPGEHPRHRAAPTVRRHRGRLRVRQFGADMIGKRACRRRTSGRKNRTDAPAGRSCQEGRVIFVTSQP